MKKTGLIIRWIFSIFFILYLILCISAGHYLPALVILVILLMILPPVRKFKFFKLTDHLPSWLLFIIIPVLFLFSLYLIMLTMGNENSIYQTAEIENKLMQIYDTRLSKWPVPYQSRYVNSDYGKVHVIISGEEDAPPLLLLHASAMSSWSWLYNIEGLSKHYRTYAIDTIGDAGRSSLDDLNNFPADGKALAGLYAALMDSLNISKAGIIGASQGGNIATNIALYYPQRVTKVVLCGPMGYTGTTSSVFRILFTAMFPIKPVRESSTHWAFGDDPYINQQVGEWFETILTSVISRQARPQPFTIQQLESIKVPVLLLLGTKDGLVGDPQKAIELVRDIPNFRTETLPTGHLISAERPEEFNQIVIDFMQ